MLKRGDDAVGDSQPGKVWSKDECVLRPSRSRNAGNGSPPFPPCSAPRLRPLDSEGASPAVFGVDPAFPSQEKRGEPHEFGMERMDEKETLCRAGRKTALPINV